MKHHFTLRSEDELPGLAEELLDLSGDRRIFVVEGEMGAGKTTLIKAFCSILDVVDPVSSPSFSILNEYRRSSGSKVYHIDLYRVGDEEELYDMGFEEVLDGNAYCFLEWPDLVGNFLPSDPVKIDIRVNDERERRILIRT